MEKHKAKIERAIVAGLDSSSTSRRLKAAELALKMGMRSEALDSGVAKVEIEHMDREQIIALMAAKLTSGPAAAILRTHVEPNGRTIEGTASPIEP